MRRIAAAVIFVFSLFCCVTRPALAQEGSATLTGFIQDSSKAVIPGVRVTAIATNTNQRFEATTSKDGSYTIVFLPVGPYQMQIEKPGFKTILKDDLFLHTQDALEVNFQMAIGSTSETVTVNGTTTNDSPAVSLTVSREFVESMPLNGRSFQDLIQLAPGTVSSDGYYSVNGQRTDSNNYMVDGVSANLGGYLNNSVSGSQASGISGSSPSQTVLATTQSIASLDSLQEFTIQTSGYAAEYGRTPGGQVQFTTRSGTDNLHGSLFEYLRNTAFDANSYQNDYFTEPKTAEHQNDFGGTVGGPLIIPKLYNGRGKTFYFFSYEGLRLLLPAFESEHVPTQAFRQWASSNIQPYLNASPLPNTSIAGDTCTVSGTTVNVSGSAGPGAVPCDELFNYGYSYPNSLDNFSVRVDQNLGKRFHAFLRYADTPSSEVAGAESVVREAINNHTWTAGLTATLTPTLIDDFRFNYTHDGEESVDSQRAIGGSVPLARNLLIPVTYDSPYSSGSYNIYVPGTSLSQGYEYLATATLQHQYQLVNSLSRELGSHSLKFGGDWRRLTPTYVQTPYSSEATSYSLTSVQQGYATSLYVSAAAPGRPVFDNLSLYLQDHWKISPRLTVEYGLRWEFNPPPGPSNGYYPATLTSSNLAATMLAPAGSAPYKTTYHHLAPRFGFAWNAVKSPNHALTVRGGFGIFFDTGQSLIGNAYANAYPFGATGPTQVNVPLPLSDAVLAPPSLNIPITPPYPTLQGISSPDLTLPYTEQWNFSVDEELNAENTLTLSYVGNNGRKLLSTQYYNGIPGNSAFPSGLQFQSNASQSSYNAFQLQDVGRIANGLNLVGSFTLAHALDNLSVDNSLVAPIWGNSNYDLRRILNLAVNYQAPTAELNRWTKGITHGWLLANRFSTQSGYPFDIRQTEAFLPNAQLVFFRPDLVKGVPIYLHGRASDANGKPVPGSWRLNPAAFAKVPLGTNGEPLRQGTLGRNYVRNPSFWALNTAVQREFPIYEELRLKFRAEAFNIFNHPSLGDADSYLTDSTFGQLSVYNLTTLGSANALYAMGAARSLQFSLRLQF